MPRVPRLDRGAVRGRGRPHAARERRRRPRGGAALGRRAASSAGRAGIPSFPARQDAPRARGDALGASASTSARRRTSTSTSRSGRTRRRARSARRSRCPGKVMLVIQPIGGPDDWRALFHEAGHAEHFANTRAELTVEERRLGDSAVTEGWAMLMEHLTNDPVWLARRLDFPRPAEFASEGAAQLLFFVRRYCAKLLYELEFHATDDVAVDAAALRRAARRRAEDRAEPDRLPRRHRRELLRLVATSARGRSRRSFARTSARSSGTRGSRAARPARSCASSGARASAGRPRTSSATSPARRSSSSRSPSASRASSARLSIPRPLRFPLGARASRSLLVGGQGSSGSP